MAHKMNIHEVLKQAKSNFSRIIPFVRYIDYPDPNPELLSERVIVYTSLFEDSHYNMDSFKLAESFFREIVGIPLEFQLGKYEDIPFGDLDHRTKFAVVEVSPESSLIEENIEKDIDYYEEILPNLLVLHHSWISLLIHFSISLKKELQYFCLELQNKI